MFQMRKPQPDKIRHFLDEQSTQGFSYAAVGATADQPPAGYVVDHTRHQLGEGEAVFRAARSALEGWQQFRLGWLESWPPDAAIRQGQNVAIIARSVGLWWLNACRIVYVTDERVDGIARFGFAYGTLPDHVGSGEERFLVELDDQQRVWYDILAFSRPQHSLARVGYPYVRQVQRRFGKLSAAAMQTAIA